MYHSDVITILTLLQGSTEAALKQVGSTSMKEHAKDPHYRLGLRKTVSPHAILFQFFFVEDE